MQIDHALHFFAGIQQQLEQTLADVPDERWAEQPAGIRNHPAWTVGHLCCGQNLLLTMLGEKPTSPASWNETMDYGTTPVADRAAYPDSATLLEHYAKGHQAIASAVQNASPETFAAQTPMEALRDFFPTVGHVASYMLLVHEATHFGQLLPWKRAAGLLDG